MNPTVIATNIIIIAISPNTELVSQIASYVACKMKPANITKRMATVQHTTLNAINAIKIFLLYLERSWQLFLIYPLPSLACPDNLGIVP